MKSHRILNIVLDTNILLVSISEYSKYHWIFRQLVEKRFNLFITNEILTEYEEEFTLERFEERLVEILNDVLIR